MKDEILKRVAEFDEKPLMVKNIILHQAKAQQETNDLHVEILKEVRSRGANVLGVIGDIAIVETTDFLEAPFNAVIRKDGEWMRCTSCWPLVWQAMLDGIGTHAEGRNSHFARYAWGMVSQGDR